MAQTVKNLPGKLETPGSIPGLGRFPGEGNGYSLQYSCLENPMDRGARRAVVHGVTKSHTTDQLTLSLFFDVDRWGTWVGGGLLLILL